MPKRKRKSAPPVLIGPDGEKKCHVACGEICLKIPGHLLSQLSDGPLSSVKCLDIGSDLKKVHMISFFKSLAKNATGLQEISIECNYSDYDDVVDEISTLVERCRKIKLVEFREPSEFWVKCLTAAGSECRELVLEECDSLETVAGLLADLLPRLVHLAIIKPYYQDVEAVKQHFSSFLEQKQSQSSPLRSLTLFHLYNSLLQVSPDTLTKALSPLIQVSLCLTNLSGRQLVSLAKAWAHSAPTSLSVESDWGSWKILPSKILVPPFIRITTLSLKGTKLLPDVVEGVLAAIAGGCAVKRLDLRGNDCSGVPVGIVRGAVQRLSVAVLTQCSLQLESVVLILEDLANGDKGELEEFIVTKVHPGYDRPKEAKLLKWPRRALISTS